MCRRTSGDGWHIDPCAASREEYGCVAWREAEESVLGEASHMSVTSHTSTGILGDASHMLVTSHTSAGILKSMAYTSGGMSSYVWVTVPRLRCTGFDMSSVTMACCCCMFTCTTCNCCACTVHLYVDGWMAHSWVRTGHASTAAAVSTRASEAKAQA